MLEYELASSFLSVHIYSLSVLEISFIFYYTNNVFFFQECLSQYLLNLDFCLYRCSPWLVRSTAEFSPEVNISNPCDLKVSFQIFGEDMRTQFAPKLSANKYQQQSEWKQSKVREVGSRPRQFRHNEKKTIKNGLFGRSGGTWTHGLQFPNKYAIVFWLLLLTLWCFLVRKRCFPMLLWALFPRSPKP